MNATPATVAVAGPSRLSVEAAAQTAAAGGNAVDVAVTAAMTALATEVAIVGLDASAFVTIWPAASEPAVLDGGAAMPGIGRRAARLGRGVRRVRLTYGGGMETLVGFGAVAAVGAVPALGEAAAAWGRLPWARLLAPVRRTVHDGFPLSAASHAWLCHSHETIYGWEPNSRAVLHDAAGRLLPPGAILRPPGLDEALACLAEEGAAAFHDGVPGRAICAAVEAGDGLLSEADLDAYRVLRRVPLTVEVDGWRIATPPAPAVGGAALAAILARMDGLPEGTWTAEAVARLADAQQAVFSRRAASLDTGAPPEVVMAALLEAPSTIHVSAVDREGLACSITASAGYGTGARVPAAGAWLNNCLGEIELLPRGFASLAPGVRLPSNMAPTVARRPDGAVLALGSPGAERIVTALAQVLLNFLRLRQPLAEAVAAPRLHVERRGQGWGVAVEEGLPVAAVELPLRVFDAPSMFFGGAGAVLREADGGLQAAADPRRQGGAAVVGPA